jgi:MSHA biogenesis protein MshO
MRLPAHLFRSSAHGARRHAGMTLIELIVVITISGIISSILVFFIVGSMRSYEAQVRRAELVDAAEMALRHIARDVRQALPNSVRIRDASGNVNNVSCQAAGTTCTIEMLNTLDGARYREGPGNIAHNHGPTQYRLRIPGTDNDGFNIIGTFQNIVIPVGGFKSASQVPPARLAIYNQAATGANSAYADAVLPVGPYVITNPANTSFTIDNDDGAPTDEHHVTLNGGDFRFRWASPNQRVFIVDTPVSYVCSAGPAGNIMRYSKYTITAAQQVTPAGVTPALLSTPVTACSFSYSPGTNQRAGLVTLDITVGDTESGEQVRLLYQAHVDNSP